jgi:hypothetical protein
VVGNVPTDNKFVVDFSLLYLAMSLSNYGSFSFLHMAMSLSKVHWYFTTFPVFFVSLDFQVPISEWHGLKVHTTFPLEPLELPKPA